jgi:hypothetical protein
MKTKLKVAVAAVILAIVLSFTPAIINATNVGIAHADPCSGPNC